MIIVAMTAALQLTPQASPPFEALPRVAEAIEVARAVAYRSDQVDWNALEQDMKQQAAGARDTADLLPAYQTLVVGLGDGHSYLQAPPEVMAAWRERHGDRRLRPDLPSRRRPTSAYAARRSVEQSDIALPGGRKTARLVVVPAFAGAGEEGDAYASEVFESVAAAGANTCGYIVDLRGNGGGNVWPMLSGLSGLLGDGPRGSFRSAQGQDITYAQMASGAAAILSGEGAGRILSRAANWRPLPHLAVAPTAILVDDGTASSGEGVALAFVGREATRSFGARTFGLASATNGYTLSDGVTLVVTVAMMTDSTGATHPEGYVPDERAEGDGAATDAAIAWLTEQASCRAPSTVKE